MIGCLLKERGIKNMSKKMESIILKDKTLKRKIKYSGFIGKSANDCLIDDF
jgi:hypothetical protein